MCGIVGYIGNNTIKTKLLDGLKELEYRGYDSAGIAVMEQGDLKVFKAVGKLENLVHKCNEYESSGFGVGIGHTRWATHGKPTEANAHPHLAEFSYVVHNGIIENYKEIKEFLSTKGVRFLSQTDTEVIVHLFEELLKESKDCFEAFEKCIERLQGAYAILLVSKKEEEKIFFAKSGSPLIFGRNGEESFFASSDAPLIGHANEVVYLNDGEYGYARKGEFVVREKRVNKTPVYKKLSSDKVYAQKDGYRYFMEKEIYEQHAVLLETMMGRASRGKIEFDEIDGHFFSGISQIRICACGTSYHAALAATYLFERIAKIPARCEIASEFRYKEPILEAHELFVVISQSGETADTLEALKMAKRMGARTLAICNVDNSSIVREADATILTRAGIEKGVASTKAFATQVMVLWMLALFSAKNRGAVDEVFVAKEIDAMVESAKITQVDDKLHERLKKLSKRYLHGHGFFFIGRDIFYPLALEGALKLKEISYLHAEGYPAGEMKHGPIALADSELFTLALLPKYLLFDKVKSNIEEISARDATILAISSETIDVSDDQIYVSDSGHYMIEFFEMMVVLQMFALEISIRLGNDVDMPRNLAKSVTVE